MNILSGTRSWMRPMKKSAIALVTSPDFLASSDRLSVSRLVVLKNDALNNKNVIFYILSLPYVFIGLIDPSVMSICFM